MYEQEKKQISHLIILISYTFFTIALLLESVLLGWEMQRSVEIGIGLVVCWVLHIAGKVPESVEKWLCFVLGMTGFVFYGGHLTSLYDMAPVMIMIIIVQFAAEAYDMIRLCVIVYFAVLLYGVLFAFRDSLDFTPLIVSRLLLHGGLVCLAAYLTKFLSDKRSGEMKNTKERIADMEEASRRTEDFLTNVSHELRTPVNAVTGLASVMLKSETDSHKRENLQSVQKAGHRLFGQIEDILDYTEIDAGRIIASEDTYMLSSLINDIITEQYAIEQKAGVEVIFDVEAKIPAVLSGDGRKIKKIIRHLVNNAVKFTEEGGVYVRLYALPKPYGINLCIQVKDTGIGMDAESLSKITEKFYQSSGGRDRRAGGLGLGLPIVYGMVAAMEGFVHVESQLDKGTTVTVSIPQKIVEEAPGMSVSDPSGLCLACYLMPEKYKVPEVRKFYDEMISHIAVGLDVTVHRAYRQDELEHLVSMYRLTHLFLAREEYEKDPDYFEKLGRDMVVAVVADQGFALREGSRVRLLPKPFYCFPIVGVLNSSTADSGDSPDTRMVCPGVRVLVVDDEPMNLMVAENVFKDYQMSVVTVSGGREAIEICQREEFDVLFIDHMMPGMDGVETLKQLRRLEGENTDAFTAVAFTANAVSGAREMFLREGFDDFLSKPIETTELERVLKKVLPKAKIQYTDEDSIAPQTADGAAQDGADAGTKEEAAVSQAGTDEISALRNAGIDADAGLNYCRNDREFYRQLLTKFAQDAPHKAEEIERLYEEEDYGNYRIQVHALKSTAKMIGADALSRTAKEMEDAAKESNDVYIKAHHQGLQEEYRGTARLIAEALGVGADAEDHAPADGGSAAELTPTDAQGLTEALRELKGYLDTYEADGAQQVIDRLCGMRYRETPVRELIGDIERDVEEFELEAAADKTAALIGRMEGGETE